MADENGTILAYHEGAVDPKDFPPGIVGLPVLGNPHEVLGEVGPTKREIGRLIRRVVDETLRHGDGSGEASARRLLDALADKLDPEHMGVEREFTKLTVQ